MQSVLVNLTQVFIKPIGFNVESILKGIIFQYCCEISLFVQYLATWMVSRFRKVVPVVWKIENTKFEIRISIIEGVTAYDSGKRFFKVSYTIYDGYLVFLTDSYKILILIKFWTSHPKFHMLMIVLLGLLRWSWRLMCLQVAWVTIIYMNLMLKLNTKIMRRRLCLMESKQEVLLLEFETEAEIINLLKAI